MAGVDDFALSGLTRLWGYAIPGRCPGLDYCSLSGWPALDLTNQPIDFSSPKRCAARQEFWRFTLHASRFTSYPSRRMSKATLLIVDDEKPTREGLRAALEERFDVYLAENATTWTGAQVRQS